MVEDLRVFRHVSFFCFQCWGTTATTKGEPRPISKGRLKEAAGVLTGDHELREEGKAEVAVQKSADTVKKAFKQAIG